jgi:hypothetical protein
MTNSQALQALSVSVSLLAAGVCVQYVRLYPRRWGYMVPPLTWLAHVLIFYTFVFLRDAGFGIGLDFILWSAIVRLQAVFLILGIVALLAYGRIIFRS